MTLLRNNQKQDKFSLAGTVADAAICLLEIKYTQSKCFERHGGCNQKRNRSDSITGKKVVSTDAYLWSIEVYYALLKRLLFKLRTPDGAVMLLHDNEVVDSIRILLEDDEDIEHLQFQIHDVEGNVIHADSYQVESHIIYLVSFEKSKKQGSFSLPSSVKHEKKHRNKRQRRHHGDFDAKWRTFS
jgi:hypothetical protein